MNKREYLSKLREYLAYELPERYVVKNLNYYSDYIDTEVSGGKSLPAVLEDLGDPQLIARSIIDAAKSGADGIPYTDDDEDFGKEIYGNGGPETDSGSGYGSGYSGGSQSSYGSGGYTGSQGSSYGQRESGRNPFDPFGRSGGSGFPGFHVYNMGCFTAVLAMLILFCVFSVVGSLLGALSPILAPVAMIFLIMWLLNRRN